MTKTRYPISRGAKEGTCRGPNCGRQIYWISTPTGRSMPMDLDGTSHFATCPDHILFRHPRVPEPADRQMCLFETADEVHAREVTE